MTDHKPTPTVADLAAALASEGARADSRRCAAESLGEIASDEALGVLAISLTSSDVDTARAAIDGLAAAGPAAQPVAHALVDAMRGGDAQTRHRAAQALAVIDPERPVPVSLLVEEITALRRDLDLRVADRTATLMRECAEHQATAEALQTRAEELSTVLRDAKCALWRSTISEQHDGSLLWTATRTVDPVFRTILPLDVEPGQTYLDAWREAILPADRERMDRTGEHAVREGRDSYQQGYTCLDNRGAARRMHEDVSLRRTGPGEWEAVGVVRDVTSLSEAEAAQQELTERVAERTSALERESASRQATAEALEARATELSRVLRDARCMLWRSIITTDEDGSLTWTPTREDDPVFRHVLPLNVQPGQSYQDAWRDAIVPPDRERMDRTGEAAIREGKDRYQQAYTCVDARGKRRRVHEDVSVRQTGPQAWEAVGVARDVTSLSEAEAAQQQLEARVADGAAAVAREAAARRDATDELEQVLRDAGCIMWRTTITEQDDGGATWGPTRMDHPVFQDIFPLDIAPGDTYVDAWRKAIVPADWERVRKTAREAMRDRKDRYSHAYNAIDRNGVKRRFHEDVSIRPAGPGRWAAVGVARDISSEAVEQARLQELETRFQAVFDNAPLGMLIRDRQSTLTHANAALCGILGYTSEELAPLQPEDLIDARDWDDEAMRLIVELIDGERDAYEVERRYLRKSGETFWAHLRVYAVRDGEGELLYAVSMLEDITYRKDAQAAIENHERERDLLLRRIVDVQEEERARISYELHDQIGQQLASLLLGLTAAEAAVDLATMKSETVDLRVATEETVEAVRQMAFEMRPSSLDDMGVVTALRRDVEIVGRSASFHAVFHAYDEERLRFSPEGEVALYRVVNAAITNTTQHAQASNVTVILQPRETDALAMVDDDGVGFDAEAVLGGPVEARLGLLAMQERMAGVGGSLVVESTPGEGAATYITLPLALDD